MSQDRMEANHNAPQKQTSYEAPNIDASLSKATSISKQVRVIHGANEAYFDNLEGKTVGSVRKSLRDVFNIPGDAEAFIGDKTVGDDFVLTSSTTLEFCKSLGVKGNFVI